VQPHPRRVADDGIECTDVREVNRVGERQRAALFERANLLAPFPRLFSQVMQLPFRLDTPTKKIASAAGRYEIDAL
jgi:hypothetical protein